MALGVGSLMAHAARRQITSKQTGEVSRAFAKVLIFHSVAFMWPPIYLLVFYFGFETSHMWFHGDSVADYPWLLPTFFLALFASNVAGFALGSRFVRQGTPRNALILFGACVLFTCGWILALPDRTMTLGTYSDWAAGTAPAASSDPAFMAFVSVVMVGYTAGAWMVVRSLEKDGQTL
jgi:hypothetical protein